MVFGHGEVGKTALINRFFYKRFVSAYIPTIEDYYRKVVTHRNHIVDMTVLDTAGQYQFPAMRKLAIQQGHGFVLVYSVDDLESLKTVKRIYSEIINLKKGDECPIVLVGNKTDLLRSEYNESLRINEINDALKSWESDIAHIETSAKDNENVGRVFETLIEFIDEKQTDSDNSDGKFSPSDLHKRLSSEYNPTSSLLKLPVTRKEPVYRSVSLENNLDISSTNDCKKKKILKRIFRKNQPE